MKILEALRGGNGIGDQMRNVFDALQQMLLSRSDVDAVSRSLATLSGAILWSDGAISNSSLEAFRKLLPSSLPGRQAEILTEELKSRKDWDVDDA